VTEPRAYGRPASFRRALTDRLKALAESSRWNLPQLQRQMAWAPLSYLAGLTVPMNTAPVSTATSRPAAMPASIVSAEVSG
jgi:hypothetical protein